MSIIPATQEMETGGSLFEACLSKKLVSPYLRNKWGMLGFACGMAPQEARGLQSEVGKDKSARPYMKPKIKAK
jgi:hypothetical protein